MLLNAQSGQIESEFARYVRPTIFPQLSSFCTGLTGISQNDVDKALPLKDILQLFDEWIQRIGREKGIILVDNGVQTRNAAFVTWTDSDIDFFMRNDCKNKGIALPEYFNCRIDAKQHYKVQCTLKQINRMICMFY